MANQVRPMRLDDEVYQAIEALPGRTLNDKLRTVLIDGATSLSTADSPALLETLEHVRSMAASLPDAEQVQAIIEDALQRKIDERAQKSGVAGFNPASVPGVQAGASDLPKNAYCRHCGQKFAGSKYATLCRACENLGHAGIPAECRPCTAGAGI